ncbi:unnamed protein product, partial [Didymodactylos carnosus]
QTNAVERTYTYLNDGPDWHITLPEVSQEDGIISSLLAVRKSVLRIGILYEHKSTTQMLFGSGCLLTDRLILTYAHNFDVLLWGMERVPYSRIYVCFCDPACESLFSLLNPSHMLSESSLLSRGLVHDNLSKYDEVSGQITDLAILQLNTPVSHGQRNEFLRPKMNSLSTLSRSSINSKLYLVGYNGELIEQSELDPYKHLKGFGTSTIDKLNFNHNANHKSISIGRFIQESSSDSLYATHNCSTLSGSGGALMLDSEGNFAGIHIGVSKSRLNKK